jgi:hypothetical protein
MTTITSNNIVDAIKAKLSIVNGRSHEHRRGYFIAGELILEGETVLLYTQHGNGSEPDVHFAKGGELAITTLLENVGMSDAMRKDGWVDEASTPSIEYQISTAFECLYDHLNQESPVIGWQLLSF